MLERVVSNQQEFQAPEGYSVSLKYSDQKLASLPLSPEA